MKKQLVSATKTYQPSYPDELLVDDKANVGSYNLITSDAVARAVAGASGEVPAVEEGDNGKILTATYDDHGPAVSWEDAPVDQTYDATSTKAQSGVAVAQAIAAIPYEVTTASGHFDLAGSVPVTVNYTGTPHVVPGTATLTNPTITEIGQTGLAVVFTINPAHALTATESGSLNILENSPVAAAVLVSYTNSATYVGGPGITADPSLPTSKEIIQSGTYTLTSQYNVPGYDAYVGFMFSLDSESDRPSLKAWAESLTLDWPSSVVDGYETTIPVIATPGSDATGKVLTVTDTQGNYGWQPVPQELPAIATNAGKVLTVNNGATGVEWTNYTQIEVVSSLPASPTSGVLYIVTGA